LLDGYSRISFSPNCYFTHLLTQNIWYEKANIVESMNYKIIGQMMIITAAIAVEFSRYSGGHFAIFINPNYVFRSFGELIPKKTPCIWLNNV